MNKFIQYRISTWQDSWGEKKWNFVLTKYVRVIFKRSGREGWRRMGFVSTAHDNRRFECRAEALSCAKAARQELRGV